MVRPGDVVSLDGRVVDWETLQVDLLPDPAAASDDRSSPASPDAPLPLEGSFLYLKYHKPRGVVCTMDERVRSSLASQPVATAQLPARVFSVGRLDKESSGLLLLTSDGRVPNAVLRSANGHEKEYLVRPHARVTDAHLRQLASGVVITTVAQRDGNRAKPLTAPTAPCQVVRAGQGQELLLFTLREGRNRQIRKMLGALGYDVLDLHRTRFLSVQLGGLAPGRWAPLSGAEMADLRTAVRSAEQWQQPSRGMRGPAGAAWSPAQDLRGTGRDVLR